MLFLEVFLLTIKKKKLSLTKLKAVSSHR